MRFDAILGQHTAIDLLRRALERDRVPHALLLVGPDGVGKSTLARTFAAAALCDGGRADACGRCGACTRVDHGNHPDFLVVRRAPRRETADPNDASLDDADLRPFIRVDQIRELNAHAAYGPREAGRRVFLIDPADRMNDEAQNALLKTLEEPPERTVVVLTAARPHVLLATVRSRCLAVPLAAVPVPDLRDALVDRGMTDAEASARAALAGGLPGRALTLDVEALSARRADLLADLEALAGSVAGLADLAGAAARVVGGGEPEYLEGLDLVQALLRDAARLARAPGLDSGVLHLDVADRLRHLGGRLGADRAAHLVAAVDEVRARSRVHANRTLQTEALLAAVAGGPVPEPRADL